MNTAQILRTIAIGVAVAVISVFVMRWLGLEPYAETKKSSCNEK